MAAAARHMPDAETRGRETAERAGAKPDERTGVKPDGRTGAKPDGRAGAKPDGRPGSAERPGARLRPLARVFPYLKRYKARVALALFFLALAAATTLALPLAVRRMVNTGFAEGAGGLMDGWFAVLVGVAAVLAFASAFRLYYVVSLGERVVADLRRDVFAHVATLSPGFFDAAQSGEIVSRLAADTTQVKSVVGVTASMALRNLILAVGAVALMLWTSPKLSMVTLASIPLILVPLIAFGRRVRARARAAQDTLADATAYASEAIGAVRTLQSFGAGPLVARRFADAVGDAFEAARASVAARSVLAAYAIFTTFASVVLVLWLGAADVAAGRMDAGTLTQFLLYAVIAATSMGSLSEVWGEIALASGSAERLAELLAEEPAVRAPAEPQALPPPRGALAFEDVTFAYPTRPAEASLTGLSFGARPGETLAVVGPSGAGKSTVFALAMRFYDPQSGTVRLDGVDVARADPEAVRERLALVPQDPVVFAMDAMENIRFGRPDATDAEVMDAARAANAHDFIASLPESYATQLGERGVTLSGGQRQRIAIARAVLKDAPVLLLDEATSALDAESEHLVQRALDDLSQGRTTLVIAHRLATVLGADRILVLEHGRLVEEGTHAELVARGGTYARLAALQFDAGAVGDDTGAEPDDAGAMDGASVAEAAE